MDWITIIAEQLGYHPENEFWANRDNKEILCKTKEKAETVACLIQLLYASQGEIVMPDIGYYDPEEDRRVGEEDEYTGCWSIMIDGASAK